MYDHLQMTDSALPTPTAAATPLDAERISADFPILQVGPNTGKRLAFLDSAASAMKPRAVIDSIVRTYESGYANVHRGVYALAATATDNMEGAREKVRTLLNASSPREIVFTRGTTEAINLVANSWGRANLGPGDIVVTTELEHHSNLVPWQQLCRAVGAELRFIPVDDDGVLDVSGLEALAAGGTLKLVTVVHASNSLGSVTPLDVVVPWAKSHGALVLVDGAQSVPHRVVDVQALGIDFLAFSGHKVMGPSGVGVLWGREELLAAMPPWQFGGEMIRRVQYDEATWNDLPWKFEAGTPAIAEIIALGAALDYVESIGGLAAINAHEHAMTSYGHELLLGVPGLRVLGPAQGEERGGVLSFTLEGTHPHDIATMLDQLDVNVRAGHHCTQPLMKRLGINATARASVYAYTTREDLDRLVDGLVEVRRVFRLP
ncbi:MAG: cysteine desulfurase, SufS subfamily [Thermoleophilia bacterium]|nr:cysteine desulfurase, SufS subfamily [Thermoleophilia bacterium]